MFNRIKVVGKFAADCITFPVRVSMSPFESSIQRFGAVQTKKLLNEYGLKYHDIMIETPEVQEAMNRMSAEERTNMDRRVMRAFDLSLKHKVMPDDLQDKATTFDESDFYLSGHLAEINQELDERNKLNWY